VEYGGYAALPIWNTYMATALRGVPFSMPPNPAGLSSVRVNRLTGQQADATDPEAIDELVPTEQVQPTPPTANDPLATPEVITP